MRKAETLGHIMASPDHKPEAEDPETPDQSRAADPSPSFGTQAAFELSPYAIVAIDSDGQILRANRAAAELLGDEKKRLDPHVSELSNELKGLPPGRELNNISVRLTKRDGTILEVSASSRALEGLEGNPASHLVWLREMNQEEDRNSKSESELHRILHDLRSPLVSMRGFAQLLRQDYDHLLDESGRRFTDHIEQAARRMDATLDGLLEISPEKPERDP